MSHKLVRSLGNLNEKASFLIAQGEGVKELKMAPHKVKVITPQEAPEMKGADTAPATKPQSNKAISSGPRFDLFEKIEDNTDRPGKNYGNFDLPHPELELCLMECQNDPRCKAFTYVRPGFQGPKARCWLKDAVPPAKTSPCCISGVKKAGATQGRPITPMKPMTEAIEIPPEPSTDTLGPAPMGSQPAQSAVKDKDINLKIPPVSAQRPAIPLTRRELVNILLKNPRTAPQLNQFASTMGVASQKLATQSSTGKVITGGPETVPSSGAEISLNWEAGIRFTPRFNAGNLTIKGVLLSESEGYEYGLSDIYQRDEVLLQGDRDSVRIYFEGYIPPGDYIIEVELETSDLGLDDHLRMQTFAGSTTYLLPWADKKALATDEKISSFIGQVHQINPYSKWIYLRISLPYYQGSPKPFLGIFRGITFTRL
jgi:hypothetical protein